MALLEIIFVFGLLLEVGNTVVNIDLFHLLGQDVTLPCSSPSSSPPSSCSTISWLYNREGSKTIGETRKGKVKPESARAARLSVDTNCSLVIKHITSDDVGRYTCRQHNDDQFDVLLYLNVLTISEQRGDDEVTLECSLLRYRGLRSCTQNGLQWMNETGTVLHEGVKKKNRGVVCLSHLTVKHQSSNNRRYTCQFVSRDKVEIQDDYTVQFTDPPPDPNAGRRLDPTPTAESKPDAEHNHDPKTYIIIGVVVGLVVLLVIITAVLIKNRNKVKMEEGVQKPAQQNDDLENNLTYTTVTHIKHSSPKHKSPKTKAETEDNVTYSAVKSPVKIEVDHDPSSVYSNVSKPK